MVLLLSIAALVIMGAKAGFQDGNFGEITAGKTTIVYAKVNELIQTGTDESKGTGMRILNKGGTQIGGDWYRG